MQNRDKLKCFINCDLDLNFYGLLQNFILKIKNIYSIDKFPH